jgi:hypothetical protein
VHLVDKAQQVFKAVMDYLELLELQDPLEFKEQPEALEALELLVSIQHASCMLKNTVFNLIMYNTKTKISLI